MNDEENIQDLAEVEDEPDFEDIVDIDPEDEAEAEAEVLRAELAAEREKRRVAEERASEAERLRVEAEDRAEAYNPVFDVSDRLFDDAEDVRKVFTDAQLREVAQAELASLNRGRLKRGYDRVDWTPEEWEQKIAETAAQLAAERKGSVPVEGTLTRVLKMYNPKSGNLIQIPIEDQVNNHKGSLADSIHRYKVKGFKLTKPMLCATRDCWEPAEVNRSGELTLGGYCSEDHRRRTEAGKESVDGVSTRQMINV